MSALTKCPHFAGFQFRPPTANSAVHRDECTQCCDAAEHGIDICLTCFNGGCIRQGHSPRHSAIASHPMALRVHKTPRVDQDGEQRPRKLTKVVIEADKTDSELYDTVYTLVCWQCDGPVEVDDPSRLTSICDAIHSATSAATKSDIRQWEEEIAPCEHTLCLQQEPPSTVTDGGGAAPAKHCSSCDQRENLWLCMTCGSVGCGRRQYDGSGGNNHGIEHFKTTGHQVSCKLGTITAEGAADVYCYTCDDMKQDPELRQHLSVLGLNIAAGQQKTEKSMAELQLEQNMKFDFSMVSNDGRTLTPVFGPGLTGIKNIGNSCYIASVVQSVFSLPPFRSRYAAAAHADSCMATLPAGCYGCQVFKLFDGLISGRYSLPSSRPLPPTVAPVGTDATDGQNNEPVIRFQDGVAPRMFKDLIVQGHPDFSTMQQQDAYEFLLYLLMKMSEREPSSDAGPAPLEYFRFRVGQRLECMSCHAVRYHSEDSDGLEIPVPAFPAPSASGSEVTADATDTSSDDKHKYQPVTLGECMNAFAADQQIEGFRCASCKKTVIAQQRSRFDSFPPVLVMHMQRFVLENWVPKKLNVPITLQSEQLDLSPFKNPGPQPGENLVVEESSNSQPSQQDPFAELNATSLEQLMAMGFSRNRSGRALLQNGGSLEQAMEWLFTKMDDPSLDEAPAPKSATKPAAAVSPELIQPLADMGFSRAQAQKALQKSDMNVERAVEWLFNNPTDDGSSTDVLMEQSAATPATDLTAKLSPKYVLHAVIAHKGTSTNCGHYVAYVRQPTGEYVLFNDERVVKLQHEDLFDAAKAADGVGMGYLYIWLNSDYTKQ